MTTPPISFPRQLARTQRFSLGVPREFAIAPDGSRIAFLRSQSGTDPVTCLWVRDTGSGAERLVVDPQVLLAGQAETLTPEERARRERTRQGGRGVVAFATDDAVRIAVFALSGRLFVADLTDRADCRRPAGPCVSCRRPARCSTRTPTRPGPGSAT